MSEPTLSLHERLREAESAGMVREAHELWQSAPVQDLAAIQKQIEDAATATLWAEVADFGVKVIALRREADAKHAENVTLRAEVKRLKDQLSAGRESEARERAEYVALKARFEAVRKAVE